MTRTHVLILALALAAVGCKSDGGYRPGPPPPIPKLPNYGGMADQVVSWLPKGAAVTLAYMDLSQIESVQGKAACETIRSTYPDRMDVYLANAARLLQQDIRVVDRRNMAHFLAEQKLQESDMVPFDPSSRVKLKKITAVNTYVYWKVVREGDIEEWVLRAVAVETGEVYGGLVHRFRIPEELRAQPRIGDLTVDAFTSTRTKEQFRLALQGKPRAMVAVGNAIERNEVQKAHLYDPEEWFVKAGDAGYAEGYYRAGKLYYAPYKYSKNKKVKNWITARRWFEKAATLGHVEAHAKLGWMYHTGTGTDRDEKQARVHYLKAAQGGDEVAMNQIGYLYRNGLGGEVDLERALHWYERAANNGSGTAANNVGVMYRDGRGVEKDDLAAIRWFRKSAWAKYGPGMTKLAQMYEQGRGVPKNLTKAQEWYAKGRKHGCREAYDHWVRVSALINKAKRERERAAKRREAEIRAATWVVIPHSLKLYNNYSSYSKHVIRTLKQGEKVHVLKTGLTHYSSRYWKILHKGQEGYVRAGLLKMLDPKPGKPEKDPTVKASEKKGEF